MENSDSSDIEILSVHISPKLTQSLTPEELFIWNELSENGVVTSENLRRTLEKYEVIATDDQINDMIGIGSKNETLDVHGFKQILKSLRKQNS
jgi:hypothetical protein